MHRSLNIGGPMGPHGLGALRSGVYDGKIAGLYDLEETLGRGHFAVVKLARHVFTGEKVAVKVIDKSKLDEVSKAHLFQEVRCMKLVQHPNVVRLYEVIDTATKLYLILELGDGGDLYDYIMRHDAGLSETLAKEYFRQIVRAITYCHQLHVVHRDLKPENVVFFQKLGVVKLTDFGFSNKFCPGQKLETSCGSLAYSAPEILLGDSYDAPAVDVWSLGVILYMLVCGQAPFQEANDSETLTMIMDCKYTVPNHVSKECKDLIARMLVRAPEKRATLAEISAHAWLATNKQEAIDILPLVSREQLTEEDHNLIVQKIVNGNIATKEEIQDCLDKNEYNHITATYFLLAERKLRSKRQEMATKGKRPEHLAVQQKHPLPSNNNQNKGPAPCLLTVPRTPGDVPQRSRKCSIVQEDEEEEDISSCSGREELSSQHSSLNRRGSRSEGRLNLALQERIAESERRKAPEEKLQHKTPMGPVCNIKTLDNRPKSAHEGSHLQGYPKWKMEKSSSIPEKVIKDMRVKPDVTPTTIITDSSTITIPIITSSPLTCQSMPKYRTMPSPTRTHPAGSPLQHPAGSPLQLNEIFEEGDCEVRPRQFVSRNQNRTSYEQRRSKFHKTRTASCSSSDASDDDSENRKKRAHKLGSTTAKPMQARRDSHDDSSDSQEPGGGSATAGNGTLGNTVIGQGNTSGRRDNKSGTNNSTTGGTTGGRKHNIDNNTMFGRRHKTSRRKSGETRLRESQSLNRITEEDGSGHSHAIVITSNLTTTQGVSMAPKVKGFGARILQGFAMGSKRPATDEKGQHFSRKDATRTVDPEELKLPVDCREGKENCAKISSTKKMRMLGKYFQVHKRIFIPIPGLFSRNKLYKARSCSSLSRDKVHSAPEEVLRQRAVSVIRNSVGSTGDINQNMGIKTDGNTKALVKNVRAGLTDMCVHLGQASKCSFC